MADLQEPGSAFRQCGAGTGSERTAEGMTEGGIHLLPNYDGQCDGLQPHLGSVLLFPEQERQASVLSVQAFIRWCRRTWMLACSILPLSCIALTVTSATPTAGAILHHHIFQDRLSGSPLMICPSRWRARSWPPGSWGHSPYPRLSTLLRSAFASMNIHPKFLCSSLSKRAHFIPFSH